jgi:hypothetical protein
MESNLLGDHDVLHGPILQFGDAVEAALLADVLLGLFAAHGHLLGESAHQFHDLRQVIVVLAEMLIGILLGVEQQFASEQFEGHAGQRPHVGRQVVLGP